MCGKFRFSSMIFAQVIANKSFSKGKPFRTRPHLLATSSPGRFSLVMRVAPTSREKRPGDEVVKKKKRLKACL